MNDDERDNDDERKQFLAAVIPMFVKGVQLYAERQNQNDDAKTLSKHEAEHQRFWDEVFLLVLQQGPPPAATEITTTQALEAAASIADIALRLRTERGLLRRHPPPPLDLEDIRRHMDPDRLEAFRRGFRRGQKGDFPPDVTPPRRAKTPPDDGSPAH